MIMNRRTLLKAGGLVLATPALLLRSHSAFAANTVWNTFGFGTDKLVGSTVVSRRSILGVAVDFTHSKIWFRWSSDSTGNWNNASTATQNPATNTGGFALPSGTLYPAWSGADFSSVKDVATLCTGATSFEMAIPSGFSAWDTSAGSTWNPSDKSANVTLSNGNLTATQSSSAGTNSMVRGTSGKSTGNLYFEVSLDYCNGAANDGWICGVANATQSLSNFVGSSTNSLGVGDNGSVGIVWYNNGVLSTSVFHVYSQLGPFAIAYGSTSHSSGKYYFEITANAVSSAGSTVWVGGVANSSVGLQASLGNDSNGGGWSNTQAYFKGGNQGNNLLPTAVTAGHVLGIAVDIGGLLTWARVDNGAWSNSGDPVAGTGGKPLPSGALFPAWSGADLSGLLDQATLSTTTGAFTYSAPTGFIAWDAVPGGGILFHGPW